MSPFDLINIFISSQYIGVVFFILLPFFLLYLAVVLWKHVKQIEFIKNIEWVLFEVKLPREITKSPQAMEIVLTALHQTNEGTWFSKLTKGDIRPWFSLELVSNGGRVRFYIRTSIKFKNLIEAQIYSQYSEVEIIETADYTLEVPYGLNDSEWDLAGFEFELTKEDPYPIKTYIDYGMDKNPEEEEKIDPMTPVIELLGTLKPGEQMWFQYLVMAAKNRYQNPGSWKKEDWVKQANQIIKTKIDNTKTEDRPRGDMNLLTPGEKKVVESIERSVGKLGFDCGIRTLYLAKKDIFDKSNFGAMASVMKQYNSAEANGFKPGQSTAIKYPWQDITGKKESRLKWQMFDAYRRRAYFYGIYKKRPFVLNTEELATIYHFPGGVAQTPTFERIESRRGEPPANLPV